MKNLMTFLHHYFLAAGIVWTLCGLSILILKLNFQLQEITLTLIMPLSYAMVRAFDDYKSFGRQQT